MYDENVQQNPLCVESCVTKKIQYFYEHTFTAVDSMRRKPCVQNCSREREGQYNGNVLLLIAYISLYSSINRLYAQNPVFEVVHDESVKVYPHMYNGNVQRNPLCVESCVAKKFSISLWFSPTTFDLDANSVLLRAHLCPAVDSKPWVRNRSRGREGLYNGNVQQNSLRAASCVTPSLPGSRLRFFIAGQIQHPAVHSVWHTPAQIDAPCRLGAHYARIL